MHSFPTFVVLGATRHNTLILEMFFWSISWLSSEETNSNSTKPNNTGQDGNNTQKVKPKSEET